MSFALESGGGALALMSLVAKNKKKRPFFFLLWLVIPVDFVHSIISTIITSIKCIYLLKSLSHVFQLNIYNYENGPCYRCLFPNPPPPESVGNCSDSGVLGPGMAILSWYKTGDC